MVMKAIKSNFIESLIEKMNSIRYWERIEFNKESWFLQSSTKLHVFSFPIYVFFKKALEN